MLIECWKPRFRSAVEGFKKACREKRFAAMNLRKNDTRILGKGIFVSEKSSNWQSKVRDFEFSKDGL